MSCRSFLFVSKVEKTALEKVKDDSDVCVNCGVDGLFIDLKYSFNNVPSVFDSSWPRFNDMPTTITPLGVLIPVLVEFTRTSGSSDALK